MSTLDILYNHVAEDNTHTDSEEFTASTKKINEFLEIIPLDYKEIIKLDILIVTSQTAAEKQGFEIGFKYAMSLIKECGLK